ncbi:MAG: PAS domain S-box protein [Anaerolineales bacterium]|nr:PAS domain S-box protein [Anaerolineales bacterium]
MSDMPATQESDSFLDIFRKHDTVMLLIEPDTGWIVDANLSAEKFYGYPLAQLRQMKVTEINQLPPEQVLQEIQRAISQQKNFFIFPHKLASGEIRIVEARSCPIVMNGRKVLYSIIQDITTSRQAEESLHASESQFRALITSMRDVVLVIDRDGVYREIAPTNPDQLFKPPSELLGRSMRDIFPAAQAEQFVAAVEKVVDTKQPIRIEYDLLLNGETVWFEATISPLGENRTLWVARNITKHKQFETSLRESEQRHRSLFDNMMDGIYRSTHEGRFVDVNPAMVKMFGYSSKEEMLHIDIKQELYFAPEERGSHILDTGRQETEVYRMRRKDGSEIWVEDHGYYVHDAQGNIIYHEGMLRDVTERVKAEEAIRDSERFLKESQMIGGLGSYVLDFSIGMWKSSDVLDGIFGIDESFVRSVEGWTKLIHPEHQAEMIRYFNEDIVGAQTRFDREYKIVRPSDGAVRWVHGVGELELDDRGQVTRMKGSIQDVTERRQMEDDLRQRLLELEALHNVSTSLRTAQSFKEVFSILLDQTLAAIGTDAGSILLYDPSRHELKAEQSRGWFIEIQDHPVQVGAGVAGMVFATGQPYISNDFSSDPLPQVNNSNKIPPGWGGACLPIRAGAEIVGVIYISVEFPRQIAPEQMKLLISLAEIAGATLHRTRLYDETARRAVEFESLFETSRAISAQTELNTLLKFIVDTAKTLLKAFSSGMYIYLMESNELELIVDTAPFMVSGTRLKMGEGLAGKVAITRNPIRVDDYSKWEGRSPHYEGIPFHAVVEVPMLYGGELIGVLSVDEVGDSERKFSENDERLLSLFASQAAGAVRSTRLREEAIQRFQNLQTLRAIDKAIASNLDLHITLNILLTHAMEQLNVDAVNVLLLHPYDQTLQYAAGRGFRTNLIEGAFVHLNDAYAGRAVMERRIVQVPDPSQIIDNSPFAHLWSEEKFVSYVCVPLNVKGEVKGVMEIYRRSQRVVAGEWFAFLETLAGQAAIAIDNSQMFDNIQRANMEMAIAYEATIEGWSRALDMRDKSVEGHTQRVTDLTMALVKSVGIKDGELQHVRRGALLHDIGKMGIADRILLKKGKLTKKEIEEMQRHPTLAFQMLQPIHYLRPALDIPYCHHEKWDGTGYPRKLKGHEIPLPARVFAVADVWDALTSPRTYREAWTKKKALAHIKSQSGKHFDPQVVDAFLRIINNFQ